MHEIGEKNMLAVTIKFFATIIIFIFFASASAFIYNLMYHGKETSPPEVLPFILIMCVVWLVFLGIFYILWEELN